MGREARPSPDARLIDHGRTGCQSPPADQQAVICVCEGVSSLLIDRQQLDTQAAVIKMPIYKRGRAGAGEVRR